MAATFVPTVAIPEAAQETADGFRTDTLYSHKLWDLLPETLPTRDRTREVVAEYAPKIHKRTTVEQLRSEIAWLRMCYEVSDLEAVAIMGAAVRMAVDSERIAPSRVERVCRRMELAAQPFGVRFWW